MSSDVKLAHITMIFLGYVLTRNQRIEQILRIMRINVTVGRVWRTIMTNKDIEEMKRNIDELVEGLNENKAFKDENTTLKQRIKDLEDIGNNYEPQFAPDDDISAFNYECVKQWTTEMGCKRKIQELQDQHQQDCIRYNDMRTAYLVTLDELARLREQFGVGK